MPYTGKNGPAPSDKDAEQAWDKIMQIAEANALIVQAFSGTATLAIPREQRDANIRERILRVGLWELEPSDGNGRGERLR